MYYYCYSFKLKIATMITTVILLVVSRGISTTAFLPSSSSSSSSSLSFSSTITKQVLISDGIIIKAVNTGSDNGNNNDCWAEELTTAATATTNEFNRMRFKAAAIRAEAFALETKMSKDRSTKLRKEFTMFDSDGDGIISYSDFQNGLEKVTKVSNIPKQTIQKLFSIMQTQRHDDADNTSSSSAADGTDTNNSNNIDNNNNNSNINSSSFGSGITINEFVGINELCNMLTVIENEEKTFAKKEKEKVLELVKLTMERINEKDANIVDRVISIGMYNTLFLDLKYLFFDIGHYSYPIATTLHQVQGGVGVGGESGFPFFETTISLISALLYQFSIPKLIISSNPGENRLLRFNCEQIIILGMVLVAANIIFASSIALVISMLSQGGSLSSSLISSNNHQYLSLLSQIIEMSSNGTFFIFVVCIGYSVISSFCGILPNEIPMISNYVTENTVITTDTFKCATAIEITSSSLEELKKTDPIKSTLLKHITNTISPLMEDNNCVYTRLPLNPNNHYHHNHDIGSIGNNNNSNSNSSGNEDDEGKIVIVKAIKHAREK